MNGWLVVSVTIWASVLVAVPGSHASVQQHGEPARPQHEHAPDDILAALPADTLLAVIVPSLSATDERFSRLTERLGITLSAFTLATSWLAIPDGLDETGSAAVALVAPEPGEALSQRLVLLLPTADRDALLTLLQPQPLEDNVIKLTLRGRDAYAGTKGRFTVLGPDLDTVRYAVSTETGLRTRLPGERLERFKADDLVLWLDPASLATTARKRLLDHWMQKRLGAGVDGLAFLEGVHGSIKLGADGVAVQGCTSLTSTAPTGHPGRATTSPAPESLLAGLPEEPFALVMGMTHRFDGPMLQPIVEALFAVLKAQDVLDPEHSEALARSYRDIISRIVYAAGSISLREGQQAGRLGLVKVLHTQGDAAALLEKIERIVALLHAGPFVDARYNAIAQHLEYRRAAETSGPTVIHHLRLDVGGFERVDADALQALVGSDGLLARVAAVDDDTVVAVLGGGLARFNEVVALARAEAAPLSKNAEIAQSASRLAPDRWLEAYVALDRCIQLVRDVTAATGSPLHMKELPAQPAPVPVAMRSAHPTQYCVEAFVPIEVIVGIKDLAIAPMAAPPGAVPARSGDRANEAGGGQE
jgi:hypothetical protein